MKRVLGLILSLSIYIEANADILSPPLFEREYTEHLLNAKTVDRVDEVEDRYQDYQITVQSCVKEQELGKVPVYCFRIFSQSTFWSVRWAQKTEAVRFKKSLSWQCLERADRISDIMELERAVSDISLPPDCLKKLRDQQKLVLYKAADL